MMKFLDTLARYFMIAVVVLVLSVVIIVMVLVWIPYSVWQFIKKTYKKIEDRIYN